MAIISRRSGKLYGKSVTTIDEESVVASVVAKRQNVSHHNHANAGDMTGAHGYHSTSSTRYYVTFQVESGDRMELLVTGEEYGMLVEGNHGKLSFQGTRYLGFERCR